MKRVIIFIFAIIYACITNAQCKYPCNVDMDSDGISDCFDKCPNTKPGVSVNSHGCPMDTDGDSVPDYMDKQLITPTECQPVDEDGIGFCPCNCPNDYPIRICAPRLGPHLIYFAPNKASLEPYIIRFLDDIAKMMRSMPNFKVLVKSNYHDESEAQYKVSWHRLNNMRNYLIHTAGIDEDRFMFLIDNFGKPNTIEIDSPPSDYESNSKLPNMKR